MSRQVPTFLRPLVLHTIDRLDVLTAVPACVLLMVAASGLFSPGPWDPFALDPSTTDQPKPAPQDTQFVVLDSSFLAPAPNSGTRGNAQSSPAGASSGAPDPDPSPAPDIPAPAELPAELAEAFPDQPSNLPDFEEMVAMPSVPSPSANSAPTASNSASRSSTANSPKSPGGKNPGRTASGNRGANSGNGGSGNSPGTPSALTLGVGLGKLPAPPYPERARRNNYQGAVVLDFTVGPDGRVVYTKVVSSPYDDLSRSVVATARSKWRLPANAPRHCRITVNFRLAN